MINNETEKKKLFSLYLLPDTYNDTKRLAHYRGLSAGALIGQILERYLKDHQEELKTYDNFHSFMESTSKNWNTEDVD